MNTQVLLLFTLFVAITAGDECSLGESSCTNCMQLTDCYWCSTGTEKCKSYINTELAQLFCPDNWFHTQCPDENESTEKKNKLEEMLKLLHNLKEKQQQQIDETPVASSSDRQSVVNSDGTTSKDVQSIINSGLLSQNTDKTSSAGSIIGPGTSSSDLKELLHKLLLLKLLRKVKNEGSATLTDEDKLLLYELKAKAMPTTTTKAPATEGNVNNQLAELLQILKNEAAGKNNKDKKLEAILPTMKVSKTTASVKTSMPHVSSLNKTSTPTKTKLVLTLNNHIEQVGIEYEETKGEHLPFQVSIHKNVTTQTPVIGYCRLYEGRVLCNKDSNCTWCNPTDKCIHRTDLDYETCAQTRQKGFKVDPCFASKHCKQCVLDEKCYWCDVSKSCHTYPFFGYVPQGCGGDWYVKQCDVQLAVIIIVLPLIMILLAMVTFYFCLKYCYYRRKVLRVPLFEKPGVFDYRKDKKVYFVHPDDESSENEMETEKFRKKYRLPMERAPLIDPNS